MIEGTTLQVPFLADLVTLADPTSRYSFLNYLHEQDRLYRFYFYERFHVPRREFDAYCRWVAEQLPACRFGVRVEEVRPDGASWVVRTTAGEHRARAVVFGVGSRPTVPPGAVEHLGDRVFHSADYLHRPTPTGRVTVVGSGQSAAEVFADLLGHRPERLDWFTRSRGFLPMEYSKLGLEHFTPEYSAYFHGLPEARRDALRSGQDLLYKGIDGETSAAIYDALYEASIDCAEPAVGYRSACELRALERDGAAWTLTFHHLDEGTTFRHETDTVVLATGYEPAPLPLAAGVVETDGQGRPVVGLDHSLRPGLFVQNAELHTHGVGAPDLGLGAHRNAVIVNAVAGREVYRVRERNVFQSFGAPRVLAEL
jgi:lysine N6-hydroxylase